jgi:myo-inositol-1(or 4)-monophosphatase
MKEAEKRVAFDLARGIALAAGEQLRRQFQNRRRLQVKRKAGGELVTSADLAAEKLMREQIRRVFPRHDILGEEKGRETRASALRWYIDPLDGTHNFVRGNPHFAVSLALAEREKPVLGVIVEPMERHLYEAMAGAAARMDGRVIRVSAAESFAGEEIVWCAPNPQARRRVRRAYKILSAQKARLVNIGAAALECAAVATGRALAYFSAGVKPWDVAAGLLLVQQAGGVVSDFSCQPLSLAALRLEFLASNGRIHRELCRLLSPGP